jgi:DNA-binding NarL/FixJ family response regulator
VSEDTIRVFLVDDHGVVRRGLRSYLGIFDDIEVVGDASDGQLALAEIGRLRGENRSPDVVLMDLAMEPLDGVETTRRLRSEWTDVEVVVVTSFVEEERVHAALEAGASGYIIKDAAPEELALAIRAAYAGEVHLDAQVTTRLLAGLRSRNEEPEELGELTAREREILALVAGGHANKEIARRLVITERTARTHVSNILRKLRLTSRTQAALLAVREGLVVP